MRWRDMTNLLNLPTALRTAAMAVWLVVLVSHGADVLQRDAAARGTAFYLNEALVALLLLAFAICMWINLRQAPVALPRRAHAWRLLVQGIAGLLVHTDLMYVVAGQAPLVLERRAASRWFAAQTAVLALWAVLLWQLGAFETLPALKDAPPAVAFGVTLLSVLTWQTFAFCVGWLAANEARHRRDFALVNAQLQFAQQQLEQRSRLEERLHISRELHDTLGHHLVAMSLQLGLAGRGAPAQRPQHVQTAAEISRRMLAEVRRVVSSLRDEPEVDLAAALQALQAAVPQPRVFLELAVDTATLPAAQAHVLLRCAQEALSNTLRHAAASNFRLTLHERDEALVLTAGDDGAGAATWLPGNGLTGMRERIEALGGTLAFDSAAGRGFRLEVKLPTAPRREPPGAGVGAPAPAPGSGTGAPA